MVRALLVAACCLKRLDTTSSYRTALSGDNMAKAVNIPTGHGQSSATGFGQRVRYSTSFHRRSATRLIPSAREWPHHLIFRQRLNALLALHKNSPYETSAPIISQLITALDIKDDPESRSNKLSLFAAMKKLLDLALSFDTSNEDATIRLFLRHINKLRSEAQVPGRSHGNVQILTCHHSKGLEFPVVFVIGVQLGIFPNDFFIETAEDLEAERRLFYVAITRAKKALFLTAYNDPEWKPSKPDFGLKSFLDTIPGRLVQGVY